MLAIPIPKHVILIQQLGTCQKLLNKMQKKGSFVSRNLVAIVIVPSLLAIHIGWKVLQDNRKLVSAEEQIDLPPITLAKYAWKRITDEGSSKSD